MGQSQFWQAINLPDNKNRKLQYSSHKNLLLAPVLSRMNAVHAHSCSFFCKINSTSNINISPYNSKKILKKITGMYYASLHKWTKCFDMYIQVSQEECVRLREGVPYVKVYRYNQKLLCPKLNGYGDNGQRSLKLWQLLHTYWLPNTY